MLFILGLAGFYLLRQTRTRQDPVSRQYALFCRKLARIGIVHQTHEGPADFARRAASARPDLAQAIGEITQLYIGLRYGGSSAEALAALRQSIKQFRSRKTTDTA